MIRELTLAEGEEVERAISDAEKAVDKLPAYQSLRRLILAKCTGRDPADLPRSEALRLYEECLRINGLHAAAVEDAGKN